MSLDRDFERLQFVASILLLPTPKALRQEIDGLASVFQISGAVAALLSSHDTHKANPAGEILSAGILRFCADVLPEERASDGDSKVMATVHVLLSINESYAWRVVDDECARLLALMKLFAKATEEDQASGGSEQ